LRLVGVQLLVPAALRLVGASLASHVGVLGDAIRTHPESTWRTTRPDEPRHPVPKQACSTVEGERQGRMMPDRGAAATGIRQRRWKGLRSHKSRIKGPSSWIRLSTHVVRRLLGPRSGGHRAAVDACDGHLEWPRRTGPGRRPLGHGMTTDGMTTDWAEDR